MFRTTVLAGRAGSTQAVERSIPHVQNYSAGQGGWVLHRQLSAVFRMFRISSYFLT